MDLGIITSMNWRALVLKPIPMPLSTVFPGRGGDCKPLFTVSFTPEPSRSFYGEFFRPIDILTAAC